MVDRIIRVLIVLVLVAVGIRAIFELLCPVLPYVLAVVVLLLAMQFVRWRREQW